MTDGVIVLDKAAGISSAKALNAVKKELPRKTKVGHAGTLDPLATGLPIICTGKKTKTISELQAQTKEYIHLSENQQK